MPELRSALFCPKRHLVEAGGRKGDSVNVHSADRASGKSISLDDGAAPAERLCPHCQRTVPFEAIFCTHCGKALAQD